MNADLFFIYFIASVEQAAFILTVPGSVVVWMVCLRIFVFCCCASPGRSFRCATQSSVLSGVFSHLTAFALFRISMLNVLYAVGPHSYRLVLCFPFVLFVFVAEMF